MPGDNVFRNGKNVGDCVMVGVVDEEAYIKGMDYCPNTRFYGGSY